MINKIKGIHMREEFIRDEMDSDFLNSPYINITLGLKHLNNNPELYLKILRSFKQRYATLDLKQIHKEELSRTLHTIKGLSATLGMESLNETIEQLEKNINESLFTLFSQQLNRIVMEIENIT